MAHQHQRPHRHHAHSLGVRCGSSGRPLCFLRRPTCALARSSPFGFAIAFFGGATSSEIEAASAGLAKEMWTACWRSRAPDFGGCGTYVFVSHVYLNCCEEEEKEVRKKFQSLSCSQCRWIAKKAVRSAAECDTRKKPRTCGFLERAAILAASGGYIGQNSFFCQRKSLLSADLCHFHFPKWGYPPVHAGARRVCAA